MRIYLLFIFVFYGSIVAEGLTLSAKLNNLFFPDDSQKTAHTTPKVLVREMLGLGESVRRQKAKNIIFFIGDGMSLNTQLAARIRKGQLHGNSGEEEQLSFEKFPTAGLVKTYCHDVRTPDSACTSTAYCCGVKVNGFTLGVTPNVLRDNCSASMDPKNHLSSIAEWAQKKGLSTGFVTTTSLTHASPTGLYGHVANRRWESDRDVIAAGYDPSTCMDLATQLVTQYPGCHFDVMMGGGMNKFLPNTTMDAHGNLGHRMDGRNLVDEWLTRHPDGVVLTNRSQLMKVETKDVKKIMGLFASDVMDFHAKANPDKQPTLMEMTNAALEILTQNPKGYFLFVEGGLIDYGHHVNMLQIAVDETLEMEKAVQLAINKTKSSETLVVVSADHAHPLTLSGEARRGDDIFGLNPRVNDAAGNPFFFANYVFGAKQYKDKNGNPIDTSDVHKNVSFVYPSLINKFGYHSDDDVGVFAHGPQSHLFTGVLEQNELPHLMAYAACIGNGPTMCAREELKDLMEI